MITKEEANRRAKFFYEKLFELKFPYTVELLCNDEIESFLEAYAKDNQIFKQYAGPTGGLFICPEEGDGEEGDVCIIINTSNCIDPLIFNMTLIHELTHCALWWQGYDYMDGQKDFENKLKELKLSSNWDITWTGPDKKVLKKEEDKEVMLYYENLYQAHLQKEG